MTKPVYVSLKPYSKGFKDTYTVKPYSKTLMEPGTFYENLRKYCFYLQGHSASLNVFPDSETSLNF